MQKYVRKTHLEKWGTVKLERGGEEFVCYQGKFFFFYQSGMLGLSITEATASLESQLHRREELMTL